MGPVKRTIYRVLPLSNGRWHVTKNGRQHAVATMKRMAVFDARVWARAHWKRGGLSQLVIHGRDGRVQTEHTYGKDPRRFEG